MNAIASSRLLVDVRLQEGFGFFEKTPRLSDWDEVPDGRPNGTLAVSMPLSFRKDLRFTRSSRMDRNLSLSGMLTGKKPLSGTFGIWTKL